MQVAIVGIVILVLSIIGAVLWVRHGDPERARQTNVLLFGLYFWILAFIQLIVVALAYALLRN